MKTLFVIANRNRALALSVSSTRQKHAQIEWELTNPDGRKTDGELKSDEPGQSFESRGTARHVLEPRTPPSEIVAKGFASRITQKLEDELALEAFSSLAIIADPSFLGLLRSTLTPAVARRVVASEPKNPAHASDSELRSLARERYESLQLSGVGL